MITLSGRCKACDKKLKDWELITRVPSPDDKIVYRELCSHCACISQQVDVIIINNEIIKITKMEKGE